MKKAVLGMLAVLGVATITSLALADNEYDIVGGKGQVTVVAKGGFHVNKDYPWALYQGDKKLDTKFAFNGEAQAKADGVAAGHYTVKGAVCNGPQCLPFKKEVDVK